MERVMEREREPERERLLSYEQSAAGDLDVRLEEIEMLKRRLRITEKELAVVQNSEAKLEANFYAYKRKEGEREDQIEQYKLHVETLSKKMDLLSQRAARANELERELNKMRTEIHVQGSGGDGESSKVEQGLRNAIANSQSQIDAFIEEVDVISQSFDEIQQQNTKLLEQLKEQSNTQVKLGAQLLKQQKDIENMESKMRKQREEFKEKERLHDRREGAMKSMENQINLTKLNLSSAQKDKEMLISMRRELESKEMELQQKVDSLESQLADQKAKSVQDKKRRLENDTSVHDKPGEKKDGAMKGIQAQLEYYKKFVLCPICNNRHKSMIIKRCLHMFCNECISTMVESRNRKCPACGEKFSATELQQVYF